MGQPMDVEDAPDMAADPPPLEDAPVMAVDPHGHPTI